MLALGRAGRESAVTYQMIMASDSNHQNSAIRGTCGFCGGVLFPGFASCAMWCAFRADVKMYSTTVTGFQDISEFELMLGWLDAGSELS